MVLFSVLMLIFVLLLTATAFVSLYLGVPFAPSNRKATQAVVQAIRLKKHQLVYELGSGDGRLAFALNRAYGVRVIGFELAPFIYLWSRFFKFFKRAKSVEFRMQNFLHADLEEADYLYCYLTPNMLKKLAIKITDEKIHTTVISHSFAIHQWQPTTIIAKDLIKKTPIIYIYQT